NACCSLHQMYEGRKGNRINQQNSRLAVQVVTNGLLHGGIGMRHKEKSNSGKAKGKTGHCLTDSLKGSAEVFPGMSGHNHEGSMQPFQPGIAEYHRSFHNVD